MEHCRVVHKNVNKLAGIACSERQGYFERYWIQPVDEQNKETVYFLFKLIHYQIINYEEEEEQQQKQQQQQQ